MGTGRNPKPRYRNWYREKEKEKGKNWIEKSLIVADTHPIFKFCGKSWSSFCVIMLTNNQPARVNNLLGLGNNSFKIKEIRNDSSCLQLNVLIRRTWRLIESVWVQSISTVIYNTQKQHHHYFDAYSKNYPNLSYWRHGRWLCKWFKTNMVIYNCSAFIKHWGLSGENTKWMLALWSHWDKTTKSSKHCQHDPLYVSSGAHFVSYHCLSARQVL